MAAITFDKERVLSAIDAVVHQTMNMDMTWDWPCGVAYFGICEAYRATGKQEYLDLMKARVDEYIELGLPNWTVNTCSMGHAMLTLHEVTGDDKYKKIAESKIDYLRNTALRFGDSVLQHTVSAKNDFPEQCWADTLFMAAFFMLRAGVAWGAATGLAIAAYTLWDSFSVTVLEAPPIPYFVISCLWQVVLLTPQLLRGHRSSIRPVLVRHWREIALVAALSPLAYVLVLTAMRTAPVSLVAPARESSIVVGSLLAWWLFKEPHLWRRLLGAGIVLSGIVLIAL